MREMMQTVEMLASLDPLGAAAAVFLILVALPMIVIGLGGMMDLGDEDELEEGRL